MGWFSRSSSSVAPAESTLPGSGSVKESNAPGVTNAVESSSDIAPTTSTTDIPQQEPTATATGGTESAGTRRTLSLDDVLNAPVVEDAYVDFPEYHRFEDDPLERYKVSDAMSQLAACSSLGANVRNYYRHGKFRNCGDKYDHLKFCLSIKTKSDVVTKVMVQKWEADLKAKKATLPNSEDVWTKRTHLPVELVALSRQLPEETEQ
ncbi:hypothetical protein BGW38_010558 [Lunasporangiospora selenospora]|uniref:Uncharacterized protein n=1 Tax=Lunasporangiospora selenospora TaxID=979761 RepID=A0A9P6KEU4_9FUNG|nr:hypothetical protein BGW38_010558 [Lunasporangiospora selenospora]